MGITNKHIFTPALSQKLFNILELNNIYNFFENVSF
jgi:hypothetical protein